MFSLQNAGHLFFLLWAVLALIFVKERAGTFDGANYLFFMMSGNGFFYPMARHGSLLVELIPSAFINAGASLQTTMVAYSLSFVFVHYACWLFCRYVIRHRAASLAIILVAVLSVKYTYYWPVSELAQGLIYSIAAYAWISKARDKNTATYLGVSFLWILLALFVHPVTIITLAFAFAYDYLDQKRFKDLRIYLVFAILIGTRLLVDWIKGPMPYEDAMVTKMERIPDVIAHFTEWEGPVTFMDRLMNTYRVGSIVAIGVLAYLFYRRSWLKIALFAGSFAIYSLMVNAAYPTGNSKLVIENMMLPLSFFTLLIFTNEVMPIFKRFRMEYAIFLVLVWLGTSRILSHRNFFQFRYDWQDNLALYMEQFPEQKLILAQENMPSMPEHFMVQWSIGVESLLRSAYLDRPKQSNLYIASDSLEMDWFLQHQEMKEFFLHAHFWKLCPLEIAPHFVNIDIGPSRFANVPDSLGPSQLQALFEEQKAEIHFPEDISQQRKRVAQAQIHLQNNGNQRLSSHLKNPFPVLLGYQFLRNGKPLLDHLKTFPLWADLPAQTSLLQIADIHMPQEAGDYTFDLYLLTKNQEAKTLLRSEKIHLVE